MKWDKMHQSSCGRFWCYKAPRSDMWELFDKRHPRGDNSVYSKFRTLRDAKEAAEKRTREDR